MEPNCLRLLTLRDFPRYGRESRVFSDEVEKVGGLQRADGSWGALSGDDEASCWGTALATITLLQTSGDLARVRAAVRWLVSARCREASWLRRQKLKTV